MGIPATNMILPGIEQEADPGISGLTLISGYISQDRHNELLSCVDEQLWSNELKRRVQHYGYRYDYKARAVNETSYLGELPDWLASIAQRLYEDRIFNTIPDQVIVNEYEPGQGISAHIDCTPCFGETIASLSLCSTCIMQLSNTKSGEKRDIPLHPSSLIVLSGAARYEWTHSIPARKSDIISGIKQERSRRVSLTFRTIEIL